MVGTGVPINTPERIFTAPVIPPHNKNQPRTVAEASSTALMTLKQIQGVISGFGLNYKSDFKKHYTPSDDLDGAPTGQDRGRAWHALQDYEMLMDKRVGWGSKITRGLSAKAVRNEIEFVDIRTEKVVKNETTGDINQWMLRTNFKNEFENELAYERGYGTGFLVFYWNKKDDFRKPPPSTPPNSFDAFPPIILYPQNLTDTGKLDYDKEVWSMGGGLFNHTQIHRDRVHVLCTREVPYDWLGRSVFDPIWLSAMAYLNVLQGIVKGIAKWGTVIPVFRMQDEHPERKKYLEYLELVETFRQNYTFILAQGESVEFAESKLGQGIDQFAEFIKEDIASGVEVSMNGLWGRSESGGIGDGGSLTAERSDNQTIANIQHDISYALWKIFQRWFDVENLRPTFKLEFAKTEEEKLGLEGAETQNDMLKVQLDIMKMQKKALKEQMDADLHLQENDPLVGQNSAGGGGNEKPKKKDFTLRSMRTELKHLTFNTTINIKQKKGDKY